MFLPLSFRALKGAMLANFQNEFVASSPEARVASVFLSCLAHCASFRECALQR